MMVRQKRFCKRCYHPVELVDLWINLFKNIVCRLAIQKKEEGNVLFKNKKYDDAIQKYSEAISMDE